MYDLKDVGLKTWTYDDDNSKAEEYTYDGDTIEDIITSHPTHENYKAFIILVDGREISKRQLEIVVYQKEEK